MPRYHPGLAIAALLCLSTDSVAHAAVPMQLTWPTLDLAALANESRALIQVGIDRHPAAMLALGVAAAVPMTALAFGIGRTGRALWRYCNPVPLLDPAERVVTGLRRRSRAAWIETSNGAEPIEIGELTRIGRSEDCELSLGDASLAEMHALIQRTADCEFFIFDVSADEETGVSVNGQRQSQWRLRDGDRIDLGASSVVFRDASRTGRLSWLRGSAERRVAGGA